MATNFLKRTIDPMGITVSNDMGTVLITSGTNVIGNRVANSLLEAGHSKDQIRVGVWKGKRVLDEQDDQLDTGKIVANDLENKGRQGATVISFDWTDPDGYEMALVGVKIVFFTMPRYMKCASLEKFKTFVNGCRKYGVEHFVTVSNDLPSNASPYNVLLRRCNEYLKAPAVDSRMSYTILHTTHLMSTPLVLTGSILRNEKVYISASYSMGVNYVSPNDVARAVIAVLCQWKKHKGKSYHLTGSWPPVYDKEVATWLGDFYNEPAMDHMAIGYYDYKAELKSRGYPEHVIKNAALYEKAKASGVEEKKSSYSDDMVQLINNSRVKGPSGAKPPRFKAETFQQYLKNTKTMTLQENPRDVEI